jgi:hypothetical protein
LLLLPVRKIDQELEATQARVPEPTAVPREATKATALEDVPQHSSAAVLRRQAMLGLQQESGNVWVARQVAQLMRQGDPAREAFLRQGPLPSAAGVDMTSSTGIGGFNAKYEPSRQALQITLRVGINAVDGLTIDPTTGVVTPANATFATNAAQVMGIPNVADRVREVNDKWHWTDAEGFRARYEQMAEHAWGERHYFVNNTWDDVFSDVEVDLQVHLGGLANDHCTATIFKVPDHSSAGPGAVVNSTGSPTGNTGTFTSSGLEATTDFLNYRLVYPAGGAAVGQGTGSGQQGAGDPGPTFLDKFIVDFQRGTPTGGAEVTVTGHASTTGDHESNQRIARERAQNVADYLRTHGKEIANYRIVVDAKGDEGATEDAEWQRVDIMVGDGRAQVTMMHETGHMFGLDDEYASPAGGFAPGAGTPGNIGAPVAHSGLAAAMGNGVPPAVSENDDNIMSVGNVVRPQHYSTFHEALTNVTAPQGWHYGGAGVAPKAGIPDLIGPDVHQPDTATV